MDELQVIGEKKVLLFFKRKSVVARISLSGNAIVIAAANVKLENGIRAILENAVKQKQIIAEVHKQETRDGNRYHIATLQPIAPGHPAFVSSLRDVIRSWAPSHIGEYDIIWSSESLAGSN